MKNITYVSEATAEELKAMKHALLTDDGAEHLDSNSMIISTGVKRPLSLQEQIERVLIKVGEEAQLQGRETLEEANNFDVEEPFDMPIPETKYTVMEDEVLHRVNMEVKNGKETNDEVRSGSKAVSEEDKTDPSEEGNEDR